MEYRVDAVFLKKNNSIFDPPLKNTGPGKIE